MDMTRTSWGVLLNSLYYLFLCTNQKPLSSALPVWHICVVSVFIGCDSGGAGHAIGLV